MGFETVAIARGEAKRDIARKLGAHRYIDSTQQAPGEALRGWAAPGSSSPPLPAAQPWRSWSTASPRTAGSSLSASTAPRSSCRWANSS
ncbi:hypothetical protein [Streptomyces sp. NPDC002676]